VQVVALYGSELRRRGEERGTLGRANGLQAPANTQARGELQAPRTTNQGELMLEPGLRSAMSLLSGRSVRFAMCLASLPVGGRARKLVGGSWFCLYTNGLNLGGGQRGAWALSSRCLSGRIRFSVVVPMAKTSIKPGNPTQEMPARFHLQLHHLLSD